MAACLMAYNGWSYVSFVAGEVRDPGRNVLRSLVLGMAAVAVLYISANVAYLRRHDRRGDRRDRPRGRRPGHPHHGPDRGDAGVAHRPAFHRGAVNGCILTGARIPFAQARDGLFFARFGEVHPGFQTPGFAILCSGIWTAILVLTGSYETLYSYSILAAWIFYTLGVGAVLVLRRKLPNAPRPYRMWGYPYTLWVFVAVSVWFMADELVTQPRPSLMAFLIVAVGVLASRIWRK